MKKIFTSLLALGFLWVNGYSQYIDENFDTELPSTWSTSSESDVHPWAWTDGYTNWQGDNYLDGTAFVMVDSDGAGSSEALVENLDTPGFDASSGNIVIVQFDQYFNQLGSDTIWVQVWDGSAWNIAYEYSGPGDLGAWDNPDEKTVIITDWVNPSGDTEVRFRYSDGTSFAWWWAIDNVVISSVDCLEPLETTIMPGAVVAEVTWESGSGNSDIQWGAAGFNPDLSGNQVVNVTSPYTIDGLDPLTSYDVYIRDNCGVDGYSGYAGPYNFTTTEACPDPYMQWNPFTQVSSFYAEFVHTANGVGDIYMILGPEDFVPGDPLSDTILIEGSPDTIWGLDAETAYDAYIYMDCTANPDDSLGYSNNVGPKSFTTLPECPTPTQPWPYDDNETTNSIDITYQLNGPGDGYIVTGPPGFLPGDPLSDTTLLTGSPFTLTGLDALTFYDYFIFMDCNADGYGYSENSNVRSFNTLTDAAGTSCGDPFILSSGNLPYTSVAQSICGYGNNVTGSTCNYGGYEEIVYVYAPETDDEVMGIYVANSTINSTMYFSITTMCPDSSGAVCVASGTMSSSDITYLLTTTAGDLLNGETYYITVSAPTWNDCFFDLQIFIIDCNTPTTLSSVNYPDSTVLTWDFVNDSTTEWQLVWGPVGFDPATEGTTVTGNYANGQESATASITGLSDTTSYDFYVTDVCGFNNVSIPAGPGEFVGPPPVNDLCENATTISCGETLTGTNITANDMGNVSNCTDWPQAPEGPTVWYTFEGDGNEIVINTCGTGWNTGLWVYEGSCDSLECVANETGNYWLGEYQCTGSYTTDSYVSFQSEAGVTYTVAVAAGTTWNPPTGEFYITMECIPCSAPYELEVMSVSNDAALLNWQTFNDGATFNYEYGISPLTPGMGTSGSGVVGVDGPTVMIEGLLADTLYDFYLYEECVDSSTDTLWTDFTTNEFAPPANDLCENAQVIACGESDTSSIDYATTFGNPLGPVCGSTWDYMDVSTIWYQFVGTGQEMNLSTCGSNEAGGSFYAELVIFTGTCDSLVCEAFSNYDTDPDCPGAPYGNTNWSIFGELGVTYYVAFTATGQWYQDGSETILTLDCIDCSTPTNLQATVSDVTANITWESFNPNADFTLVWDTTGFDVTADTSNTITGTFDELPVLIDGLLADGTYDVYVWEYCTSTSSNTDTIDFSFTTNPLPPPVNDLPCNATPLVSGDTLATTNAWASADDGEIEPPNTGLQTQDGWGYSGVHMSTWYTFTPDMGGWAVISTCHDGSYDTQLAVYTITDCGDYSTYALVGANDDMIGGCDLATYASEVYTCLESGVTYYIQVDPYSHPSTWNPSPGQDFSISVDFEGAEAITSGAFPTPHTANIIWDYIADIGGNTDYTLYYTNTVSGVEESVTGNSADNPTVLTGLDDDTDYTYYIVCDDMCSTTSEMQSFTTLPDGINELGFGKNVNVYPNPASDLLTIEINADVNEGSLISIVNMQGKIIYSETVKENTSEYRTEIDVDNYARGIYLLKLEDENSSIQQRIIVQ